MGSYSKQYRATAAPSVGANWSNAANIYDSNVNSYAQRSTSSTSATHINEFGINLPSYAVVESVEVHTKAYLSNTRGYLYVYLYSDSGPTLVKSKQVANGASLSAQYVTQTYTADELIEVLTSKGLHGSNLIEFLKNVRVRFVIGSTSSYLSSTGRIYDNYLVINYRLPDYTLTVTAGAGGTVTGSGTYEINSTATLIATPNIGYKFKQWSDGNTNATRTVTVTGNATYAAEFEKTACTITTTALPATGGTVMGGGTYESGISITLTAEPTISAADGAVFQFKQWSDGDKSNPRTVTVTGDATYTAEFEQLYTCGAVASPEEGGTIVIDASDTSDMGEGWYPTGTLITFTVTANEGYKFVKWHDENTSATRTVTVGTSSALYLAYFEKVTITISASASPEEGGTVTGAGIYEYGDAATLTAIPNPGYQFIKWSDGSTSQSRPLIVNTSKNYIALFKLNPLFLENLVAKWVFFGSSPLQIFFNGEKII